MNAKNRVINPFKYAKNYLPHISSFLEHFVLLGLANIMYLVVNILMEAICHSYSTGKNKFVFCHQQSEVLRESGKRAFYNLQKLLCFSPLLFTCVVLTKVQRGAYRQAGILFNFQHFVAIFLNIPNYFENTFPTYFGHFKILLY